MIEPLAPLADARWIGSSHPFDLHEVYLCFRSPAITLAVSPPATAKLLITADSRYRLWVNGQFVARGPERCYPQRQSVDCLDVRPYLKAGENRVTVQVYQPGYSHFAYLHRGATGLIAALQIDGATVGVSDGSWRVRRDPSWSDQVRRISIYGSGVEMRDLRLDDGWMGGAYDDTGWDAARVVALPEMAPWTTLQPRSVPLLQEREHGLQLLATRRGPVVDCEDSHDALRTGWLQAEAVQILADADGWYTPALGPDEAAYWLFDLGRSYVHQGWVEIVGATGRETLLVSYAEKLRDGGPVLSDPATYCRVRMTDCFRLRPGDQQVQGFALRGGRLLLFALAGSIEPELCLRFHARVSEYPLAVTKTYAETVAIETSPAADDLAAIATMCEETLSACLQDSFIDCGWRENSQWLGDALPQALILAAMSDDVRPLRKVLTMAAAGAYPDGVLPSILPGEVHAYAVLDYNFVWVELLTLYLQLTGERGFVADLWPALARMLDRFDADVGDDQLIRSQPGRRLFLDWAPLSRSEPNALYNLRYLYALQHAIKLARTIPACDADALLWSTRAKRLQQAILTTVWQDGRWYDDGAGSTFSQHAAAFALLTESTPPEAVGEQLDLLAGRSLDPCDEDRPGVMVLASPFIHHYVFEALKLHGRYADVLAIIRLRWGRWAAGASPTTWEHWNVDFPDGSESHAFSAHPRYHLYDIARRLKG